MIHQTIIYPGTFDPITKGHSDLINRAANLFGHVIVAIAASTPKPTLFTVEERLELATAVTGNIANVSIARFDGLLVKFAMTQGSRLILRGLRAVSDFEYEFQLAGMNRKLAPTIETFFLMPAEKYTYISSSLVKEIARLGGDVNEFVHDQVKAALSAKLG